MMPMRSPRSAVILAATLAACGSEPTYRDAPELSVRQGIPKGNVYMFNMDSRTSQIYQGNDPGLTAPGPFMRGVWVYVPKQYVEGSAAPFIVVQDGQGYVARVETVLDNLIADKKLPAMVAVLINPGPG